LRCFGLEDAITHPESRTNPNKIGTIMPTIAHIVAIPEVFLVTSKKIRLIRKLTLLLHKVEVKGLKKPYNADFVFVLIHLTASSQSVLSCFELV